MPTRFGAIIGNILRRPMPASASPTPVFPPDHYRDDDAFVLGRMAWHRGETKCPYGKLTLNAFVWRQGWAFERGAGCAPSRRGTAHEVSAVSRD